MKRYVLDLEGDEEGALEPPLGYEPSTLHPTLGSGSADRCAPEPRAEIRERKTARETV